uniref:Uncharacterized protein n=1 Tax=Sinocyclocheilus rhinocerous TaxID=307959 RepID=A0A673FU40_9TELE
IKRTLIGPGPQCATGGFIETEKLGSEASGKLRLTAGIDIVLSVLIEAHINLLVLTDNSSVSVRFQKVFQNCISRFCVMRSNSVPLNSGSTTYLPDFSPKDTILMTTVCRKGLREGENLEQRHINRLCVSGTSLHTS